MEISLGALMGCAAADPYTEPPPLVIVMISDQLVAHARLCGAMDSAIGFGPIGCRFESCQGRGESFWYPRLSLALSPPTRVDLGGGDFAVNVNRVDQIRNPNEILVILRDEKS